jgi:hypothetical protein
VGSSVYRGSGNVGIGNTSPNAKLTVGDAMGGVVSGTFTTNSGELGTSAGNEKLLASFGLTTGNTTSLGISAYRNSNGGDWYSTSMVLGMNVDSSWRAGAFLALGANGGVGIGTANPSQKLDIAGGLNASSNVFAPGYSFNGGGDTDGGMYSNADGVVQFRTNGAERMRINGSGNIGIGTSNPSQKLSIEDGKLWFTKGGNGLGDNGGIGGQMAQNDYFRIYGWGGNSNDGGLYIETYDDASEPIIFRQVGGDPLDGPKNYYERMRIASNGYVGIGYSSPGVPLYVGGSQGWNWNPGSGVISGNSSSGPQIGNPDAFTANGGYGSGNLTWPLTIYAEGAIAGSAFVATSDHRIKDIVARSSTRGDLDLINKLQVTDYRLKDSAHAGTAVRKGFIAQEIGKVIPEAVSTSRNFLPDVYQRAVKNLYNAEKKRLSVTVAKPHALAAGDWVRVYVDETMLETKVLEVLSPTVFVVASEKAVTKAFVYGRRVDDFLSVDYDRIFTTGIGAIQELDSKLKNESAKVDQLQKKVADLESKFAAQARKSATPKAETGDGKAALQSKRGSDLLIDFPATEEITRQKDEEINELKTKNAELEARLSALEKRFAAK